MADGRRNWQRWLDQVIDSLGSMPFYDTEFVWDPTSYAADPRADRRDTTAIASRPSQRLRLHSSRNLSSGDGPSAA